LLLDVQHGDDFRFVEPVNLYGCRFGKDVFVGPFVEVQSGVIVGDGVRIQSHTFICSGVTIGNETFIGHGVMFVNDLFENGRPARGDKSLYRTTDIGDNVSIGSGAVILPVEVVSGSVIGAGAVVTKDLEIRGIYVGNPAQLLREFH
jgi:acetyltransferase-like isoleucine patch superfamily enzyme